MTIKEKIIEFLETPSGKHSKYTALEVAEAIGHPIALTGYYGHCPQVGRVLTQLCKEGVLYQWVTGNGSSPVAFTNVAKYDVNYLRQDSQLAKDLKQSPSRILKGYRFK